MTDWPILAVLAAWLSGWFFGRAGKSEAQERGYVQGWKECRAMQLAEQHDSEYELEKLWRYEKK